MSVFARVLACNSRTVIELQLAEALKEATPADGDRLRRMKAATSLEEVHALACEALGLHQAAADIRDVLALRVAQGRSHSMLEDCPEWDGLVAA